MNKSKRIFYLDFIRAIAVVLIVLTHYNALYIYMWDETVLDKVVITSKIANLYIGDFGVSLFIIVSGAALMVTYKTLDLKKFYKKRFLSIYPMFWIAYFVAFMHSFYLERGIDQSIPKKNIFLSVIGFDGYLNGVLPTFYKVGEWFLGFIIIMYLIFPLLKFGLEKYEKLTFIIVGILYCLIIYHNPFRIERSICIFTRIPEMLFGMYFVSKIRRVRTVMAWGGAVVLILNTVLHPAFNSSVQTTYVGISAFILLAWIGQLLQNRTIIIKICSVLSKYSYAIFLTHHYIIWNIASKFDLYTITVLESYLLFLLICCVIAVCSWLLFIAHRRVCKLFHWL